MKKFQEFLNESLNEDVSKKDLTKILKDIKVQYVTQSSGDSWGRGDKAFVNHAGKKIQGIKGGSQGPMTTTDAHKKHNSKVKDDFYDDFHEKVKSVHLSHLESDTDLDLKPEIKKKIETFSNAHDMFFIVPLENESYRLLGFSWETFPTYLRSAGYDDAYVTWWFVMYSEDIKIKNFTPLQKTAKKFGLN